MMIRHRFQHSENQCQMTFMMEPSSRLSHHESPLLENFSLAYSVRLIVGSSQTGGKGQDYRKGPRFASVDRLGSIDWPCSSLRFVEISGWRLAREEERRCSPRK